MLYHILIIIKPLNIPINSCIIESVDSICRDSADTYMLIQKILKISKTANL